MSSLFIIGNGFDLAHGVPTKYSNFRDYILECYPEAKSNRDLPINLEDYLEMENDQMAAELLLYAMDHTSGETWADFEDALSRINFNDKIPRRIHDEDETEEEDDIGAEEYLRYVYPLIILFSNATKLWGEFFRLWLKSIEHKIENGTYESLQSLTSLFKTDSFMYFSFNYTKTLQNIYGVRKVIHIHNRIGQNLIFGHGKEDIMYNGEIMASALNDMLNSFKKDTDRQLKKYSDFFKKLDNSVDKVYSYGFSYSSVDMVYIRAIISKVSKDTTWYFTKFESQNTEEMRRRKIKLRRNGFKGKFDVFEG